MATAESSRMRKLRWIHHEKRSIERLRICYDLERQLREELLSATQDERRGLYTDVYDRLMSQLPDQPFHTKTEEFLAAQRRNALFMLGPYLHEDAVYLEVGPGTCNVAFEVAKHVKKVIAIDVSYEILKREDCPANVEVVVYDGVSFDVELGSVDVAYSNQLLEHIHVEDGRQHMRDVFSALRPGGVYICRTPNRLSGPHDISMFFVERPPAEGLHLWEYTYKELTELYKASGFQKVSAIVGARGRYLPFHLPANCMIFGERFLELMPEPVGSWLARTMLGRAFLTMQLVGHKAG